MFNAYASGGGPGGPDLYSPYMQPGAHAGTEGVEIPTISSNATHIDVSPTQHSSVLDASGAYPVQPVYDFGKPLAVPPPDNPRDVKADDPAVGGVDVVAADLNDNPQPWVYHPPAPPGPRAPYTECRHLYPIFREMNVWGFIALIFLGMGMLAMGIMFPVFEIKWSTYVELTKFMDLPAIVDVVPVNITAPCPAGYIRIAAFAGYTYKESYYVGDEERVRTKRFSWSGWKGADFCGLHGVGFTGSADRVYPAGGVCPQDMFECPGAGCFRNGNDCPLTSLSVHAGDIPAVAADKKWYFKGQLFTLQQTRGGGLRPILPILQTNMYYNIYDPAFCLKQAYRHPARYECQDLVDHRYLAFDNYTTVAAAGTTAKYFVQESGNDPGYVPSGPIDVYLFFRREVEWNEAECPYSQHEYQDGVRRLEAYNLLTKFLCIPLGIGLGLMIAWASVSCDEDNEGCRRFGWISVASMSVAAISILGAVGVLVRGRMDIQRLADSTGCTDAGTTWQARHFVASTSDSLILALVLLGGFLVPLLWIFFFNLCSWHGWCGCDEPPNESVEFTCD